MEKLNLLTPSKDKLYTYLYTGIVLFFISILDVFLNSFFNINLTSFLPSSISFILPLVLGLIGTFNAFLSLIIIFIIIKSLPPFLSWFVLDANIAGDSKDACTGSGACWTYIKIWFNRFMYGMYPNEEQWRINLSFISLGFLGTLGFFATEKYKKYLTLYYVIIYPIIALLFIYFFISGGPIFFDFSYGIIAAVLSIIIGFFIPSKFKMYYFIIVPINIYQLG